MNVQNLKKLNKPSAPVTVAQIKEFLRIDHNDEDLTLDLYIKAATNRLEKMCDTVFVQTEFLFTLDDFPFTKKDEWWDGVRDGIRSQLRSPKNFVEIPVGPINEVTEFKYEDYSGTVRDFPNTEWKLDDVRNQGRITLNFGAIWPAVTLAANNAVRIKFKAGLVSTAADLPEEIKLAVMQLTAQIYERRGDELPEIPGSVMMLVEPYRRFKV